MCLTAKVRATMRQRTAHPADLICGVKPKRDFAGLGVDCLSLHEPFPQLTNKRGEMRVSLCVAVAGRMAVLVFAV